MGHLNQLGRCTWQSWQGYQPSFVVDKQIRHCHHYCHPKKGGGIQKCIIQYEQRGLSITRPWVWHMLKKKLCKMTFDIPQKIHTSGSEIFNPSKPSEKSEVVQPPDHRQWSRGCCQEYSVRWCLSLGLAQNALCNRTGHCLRAQTNHFLSEPASFNRDRKTMWGPWWLQRNHWWWPHIGAMFGYSTVMIPITLTA